MAAHNIPPNGTSVSLDTEPNRPALSGENAFSEIEVNGEVRNDKAKQCLTTFRNPGSFSEYRPRKIDGKSVLCEGFSIREYVAKVRSVDIRKCWPLSESLLQESLREGRNPTLPPLVRSNHRWWSCFDMCGEHKHFGASFDRQKPENYSQNVTDIEEQQLMVSLETDPDVCPWISQDEQLRKLRTVQIPAQEDLFHIPRSEYANKNIENKSERLGTCLAEEHDKNFIAASSIKDAQSKIEAPKRTSMSDVNAHQLERTNKCVKADLSDGNHAQEKHTVMRDFHNHTQVKSSTLHLMEKEGDLQNDIGNCKKKAKAMRAPDEQVDQAQDQSVSLECERNKIDERNSETAKIESPRQHNLDIGTTEGSGVKICPVCRTFTSATITAVNAHMDNCLAQVSKTEKGRTQKQKSRPRKKRSIVDICAAAPPVKTSQEYLDNYQMDGQTIESDCSDGMEVSSDQVTDNGSLKEVMNSIQTDSETAARDESTTFKCKRKQPVGAHYFIATGKPTNGDGQAETLEMKRRRQRLGIINCGSGSKDLKESWKTVKMPSSTQATKAHKGVEHHLMHHAEDSGKQGKLRQDSKGEQLSNMQLNSEQHCDVARDVVVSKGKSHQQWSGTLMHNATPHPTTDHSAAMLPEELKALKYSTIDIPRGENGQLRSKECTEKPSPVPTISDGTGNVSQISGVADTMPSGNESTHVHTEKPQVLGDSECTHQNGDTEKPQVLGDSECTHQNGENCKLQVEEGSSKQGYLNLLRKMHFKDNNRYMEASNINPGKMVGSKELNAKGGIGTCSKATMICSPEDPLIRPNVSPHCGKANFGIDLLHPTEEVTGQHVYANSNLSDASNSVCLQSVDRTRANSMALNDSESRKVTEGPTKNTGLNLNQKICALPRDSKGRFISSARMNGGNEGEILYSRWKQADGHKPIKRSTNSVKTSAVHNETNFVTNAALSNSRFGKSTSIQTLFPVHRGYHCGKRCLSRDKCITELNGAVAGQAAFSSGDVEIGSVGMEVPLANTKFNHVAAPLPEKAMDLQNFFIQRRCSDYAYIGWPLDSQGELIKYIPNTTDCVNELYRVQNCTTGKEPLVAECSKWLPDFNFVESMHVSNNISEDGRILEICSDPALCNLNGLSQQNHSSPCKQADYCHQHSASKNNQLKCDKVGLAQSSALGQSQREYVGNSQIRTTGSSVSKTDTSSTLTACMHSNIESGYNGEQKQKSPVLEKTCPEVQSSRKEQPTTQPVMRLMGYNFIIGGENEAGNTVKVYQQGSDKKIPSTSEVTWDVSSSNKANTVYRGYSSACKEGELSFPNPGINALCQHSIRKENLSESPQNNCKPMESLEATYFACNRAEDLRRLNSSVPKLVEKRFPTSCVRCEQSLRSQFYSQPRLTSTSPFCAIGSTVNSPVSHLSNNVVNEGDKVACKYSSNYTTSEFGQTEQSRSDCNLHGTHFQNAPKHIRDPARVHQNQVYSQSKSSSLELHGFPKPVNSGCKHTSRIGEAANNPGSLIIQSDALQILENQSKCKSSLPQWLLNAQKQNEEKEGTSYNKKQHNPPVPSSRKMEFVTQKLSCVSSSWLSFSDPLHDFTSAPAHPPFQTTFPSDCETLTPTDSAILKMNWRYKYDSKNLHERENLKLPKNMSRNICVISHNKGTVPDTMNLVSPESKRPSDRMRDPRKASDLEAKELHGKWLPQRHEGYAQCPSPRCDLKMLNKRKRDICHETNSSKYGKKKEISENDFEDCRAAEICITNDNSVDIAIGHKNRVNDTFSNPSLKSGVPRKCQENEGTFRKPKSNLLESQNGASRIGLHSSSIESSLKLAEPMKLSGGAKHILKPPPPNGNVKQSLPIHYTLPFVETTAEEREGNLHGTNRYSGEQQRSPPGSKLLRWASSNSNLSQKPSNGEGRLSH